MMGMKGTRITLVIALLLAVAVVWWLVAHPQLYAGHMSRLLTRNLLRQNGISFRYSAIEGNVLGEMRLLGVDLSWQGRDGSFAYLQVDTLEVSYDLTELLRGRIHAYRFALLSSRGSFRQGDLELPEEERSHGFSRGPAVAVEEAVIRDLQVRWIHPDGREENFDEVNWWGGIHRKGKDWIVDTRSLSGRWPQRAFHVVSVWGRMEYGRDGMRFVRLRAATDSTQVEVDGWYRSPDGFDLQVEAAQVRLGEVLRVLGNPSPISADLAGSVRLEGLMPLDIEGSARGQVAGYTFDDTDLSMRIGPSRLLFSRVEGRIFDAPVRLTGDVDTRSERITLSGTVDSLDLSRRWVPDDPHWPASSLSGRIELAIDLKDEVGVELHGRRIEGVIAQLPVDSLEVVLHFREDEGARFETIHGRIHHTWVDAEGSIDAQGRLEMPFTARAGDLAPWLEAFELPLSRAEGLSLRGRFHGAAERPALSVEGWVERVVGGRLEADGVRGTLELAAWDDLRHMSGHLEADTFAVGGRRLGRLQTRFEREGSLTRVPLAVVALGDTALSARGQVVEAPGAVKVQLEAARFQLGDRIWSLDEAAEGELGPGWARAGKLHFRSDTGEWMLQGGVDSLGTLDLDIDLTGGDLSLLSHLGQGPADLRGRLEGRVTIGGSRSDPHFQVNLSGEELNGWGRSLDRLVVRVEAKGRKVSVDRVELQCPQGSLLAHGSIDLPWDDALHQLFGTSQQRRKVLSSSAQDLRVELEDFNARYWLQPTVSEEDLGRTDASLTLNGTLKTPLIRGEVEVSNYTAGDGSITIPSLRAWLESDGHVLGLHSGVMSAPEPWLHFNAVLPLHLSFVDVTGWREDEGVQVELTSDGEVELKPLANILSNLSEATGRCELVYRAQGSMSHPRLEGYLKIRDGVVQLEGSLERLRDLQLDATLADSTWTIDRLTAREGMKGTVSATGAIDFSGLLPDDIHLDIEADRFLFASFLHLRALLRTRDFHMDLKRPGLELSRRPYFHGTVEVIKARYTGEFGGSEEGGLGATTSPAWLADIRLKAPRTVRVQNRTADLLLDGDVDLVRDMDGLRFNGVVEIPQGRVSIFNNDFDIVQGILDYSRSRGLEPSVEIEAKTRVPDYRYHEGSSPELEEVRVFLSGTFSNLKTRFESDSGYDEETIVRLLAGFSEEPGQGSLADTGFKAGLNYIERSIAREIKGIDTLDIETESASIAEASRTRVAVGKYLSSDLYLRYSQGLSISERELFLEYQMTRTLRLSSELGMRLQSGVPTTTFNVELKYRVEY